MSCELSSPPPKPSPEEKALLKKKKRAESNKKYTDALAAAGRCKRCARDKEGKLVCDYCQQQKCAYDTRLRFLVLDIYGGECRGCHTKNKWVLQLDHKDNNGNQIRRTIKNTNGKAFVKKIMKDGYPDDLQILCANCNMSKHITGYSVTGVLLDEDKAEMFHACKQLQNFPAFFTSKSCDNFSAYGFSFVFPALPGLENPFAPVGPYSPC